MAPTATTTLAHARYSSPVGLVDLVGGLAGLRRCGWSLDVPGTSDELDETMAEALAQVVAYFAGELRTFDLVLDLPPMEPRKRAVLDAMATIEYGEVITYAELGRRSGTGLPPRAIGSLMGGNPVPIVIPCHRVVAADGLGGFSGGERGHELATKRWLLEHEGALPPSLF
ncbi:methylated-DNA--[protein]-cysteine S-methyltransferase [uncultured Friedmanniella sp.]|uniref:methylated-DNA--[protein]-cysteine S-methyltransferase n=1 Tax=uncultured Friedmanniella sp. TaxID=335381 RepID=UPI0035CB7645